MLESIEELLESTSRFYPPRLFPDSSLLGPFLVSCRSLLAITSGSYPMGAEQSAEEPTIQESDTVQQSHSIRSEAREPRSGSTYISRGSNSTLHSSISSSGPFVDNLDSSCRSVSSRLAGEGRIISPEKVHHKPRRKKNHLAWELSDSDDDHAAGARRNAGGASSSRAWTPFMTEEDTFAMEEEEARTRQVEEVDGNRGGAVWKINENGGEWNYADDGFSQNRESYEQGVLHLKASNSRSGLGLSRQTSGIGLAVPPPPEPRDGMQRQLTGSDAGDDISSTSSEEDLEYRRKREKASQEELRVAQEHLGIEMLENNMRQKKAKMKMDTVHKAVVAIQHATVFKLKMMHDNMNSLNEAEITGKGLEAKQRKMLSWIVMATVCKRMCIKLKDGTGEQYKQKMLKSLAPPPLPPPSDPPPSKSDEQLHYDYEDMRAKYAHQWEKAGQTMLGKVKFDEIRNMRTDNGPSQRMKQMVMQKCSERADVVMSEQEHQEFIKRAWRLKNDWQPAEEYEEELHQARVIREARVQRGSLTGATGSHNPGKVQLPNGAR